MIVCYRRRNYDSDYRTSIQYLVSLKCLLTIHAQTSIQMCWRIFFNYFIGFLHVYLPSNPYSTLIPPDPLTPARREGRLEGKGAVDLFKLHPAD